MKDELVKENPDKGRQQLKPFLDSQIIKANLFCKELSKTQEEEKK